MKKPTTTKEKNQIEIRNKRATFEYFLLDEYNAGLVLTGTEIKSIRDGKANLADAYCVFIGNELFVREMHVSEYRFGSYLNHPAKRDRKLLLTRKELRKLQNKIKERGLTIIPVMLYVNPSGLAKLQISLARGKKFFDKRDSIKEKDSRRDLERQLSR
ncbi:MAG: SsrA-binding protein SmpB [Bacteroidales bacterium]|nr:SsrA-binding protein SmpB [Bacteroidales bacterium]